MLVAPAGRYPSGPNGGGAMAARTRYAPDRGLTARMTATMFLLGLVFVGFVAAIIGIGAAAHASDAVRVRDRWWLPHRVAVLRRQDRAQHGARGRGQPERRERCRVPARHRGPGVCAGRHAQAADRNRPIPLAERL